MQNKGKDGSMHIGIRENSCIAFTFIKNSILMTKKMRAKITVFTVQRNINAFIMDCLLTLSKEAL